MTIKVIHLMLTEINSHCASNRLNIVRHKGNEWQMVW